MLEESGFVDIKIGPPCDTFGGASGEKRARTIIPITNISKRKHMICGLQYFFGNVIQVINRMLLTIQGIFIGLAGLANSTTR